MRRFSSSIIPFAVLVALVFSAPPAPAQRGGGPGGGRPGPSGDASALVTAETAQRSHVIAVAGRLEPRSRIVHSIPSSGFVVEVSVREGQTVAAGDLLLTVRRRDDVLELYQPIPLTARISGRVAQISVGPASEVQAGEEAVVILGADGYTIETLVTDKDAFRVEIGRTVVGRTPDGTPVSGTLISRSQEPDYDTGLFSLTFAVPSSQRVRLGEFVIIDLPVDRLEGIFVPRDAVVRRFGADTIWVVTPEGVLEGRAVTIGDTFGDEVYVAEGVSEGDRYVAAPTGRERDGQPFVTGDS